MSDDSGSGLWAKSARLTNALLLAVLTTTGGGAVIGKSAYDGLAESQVGIRIELSRLSDSREHDTEWRRRHESAPHESVRALLEQEATRRRALADRVRELELAAR